MMQSPQFTIITVAYNAAATIERTLRSVLRQEPAGGVEYIIVDGGSTDGTLAIVERYREGIAEVVSEPDDGIYDAMNKGIARAKGAWIGLINSDDWYAEGTLRAVASLADQHPEASVIVGGMLRVAADLKTGQLAVPPARFSCLKPNNHPATFVRQSAYRRLGMFDTKYHISADLDFILRAQADPETMIVTTPEPIAYMRVGGVSGGFAGVGEACRVEARYNGMAPAVRLFGRKLIQKTRAFVVQRLLPPSLFSRLQRRWWAHRHAQSQPLAEKDVHF